MTEIAKKPRILYLGEEIDYDTLPDPDPVALEDYFKPVRISPEAIDQVSKIVPSEHYVKEGLHTWISKRANFVFSKLTSEQKSGRFKALQYFFEYDANGPVLKKVTL